MPEMPDRPAMPGTTQELHSLNLFTDLPARLCPSFDPGAPWTLLGEPLNEALARLPRRLEGTLAVGSHLVGDAISVGEGSSVASGVVIEAPAYIGRGVEIRPGAYLRGGVWIEDGAVVGANTEVKRAIFLARAKAPHLNYVGDSILGAGVNLGAGTILANFRHDGSAISIPGPGARIETGRRKLGAILGDRVMTGCNCVLHPGVIVGPGCRLYPGVQLRSGIYPGGLLVKLRQELIVEEQR